MKKTDLATPSKPNEEILCKDIYVYLNKRKLLSSSTSLLAGCSLTLLLDTIDIDFIMQSFLTRWKKIVKFWDL